MGVVRTGNSATRLATLLSLGSKPGMVITQPFALAAGRHHSCGAEGVLQKGQRGRNAMGREQCVHKLMPVGKENAVRFRSQLTVVLGGGEAGAGKCE